MPCILLFSAEFVRKLKFPNNSNGETTMEAEKAFTVIGKKEEI
jgi:hypothetical protein